jgi:hypothetical protein
MNNEIVPEQVIAQEKVVETVQQAQEHIVSQVSAEPQQKQESNEDPNWRAFREARKKDRAEREAAEKRAAEKEAEAAALRAAMEAAFSKQNNQVPGNSYEYAEDESEDARIEKKVQAAIAAREQEAERKRQQREQEEYPQRLVQSIPDFNNVVTTENMDYLDYHHPEIARILKRLPDGYDKWSDVYSAIKKYVPNSTTAKKEAAKAEFNNSKPKSMSTLNAGPTGQVTSGNRLSEDKKQQNWERMQKLLKSVG